jgi:parallel beta-helix repeat protein
MLNTCNDNGAAGILSEPGIPSDSDNAIEGNLVTDNAIGIDANPATGNYIAGNRASGNTTTDYDIIVGNQQAGNISF